MMGGNSRQAWQCWTIARRVALLALVAVLVPAGMAHAELVPASGSPVAVGAGPWDVNAADVDGDGRQDLLVPNLDDDTLSVLLGRPNDAFVAAPGSPVGVGDQPFSSTVADFNSDGRPDLAVTAYGDANIRILLRKADNSGFVDDPTGPVPVGYAPYGIAAPDVNGDGRPDLAVTNYASFSVSVLTQTVAGTFTEAAGSPFALGSSVTGIVAADFDGDGDPDLAVAVYGADKVVVLKNGPSGYAAEGAPIDVGSSPTRLAAADLNGDGRKDLAVANSLSDNVTLLLRNADNDGFEAAAASPVSVGDGPYDVALEDLDGDGARELITSNLNAGTLSVLKGTPALGYAATLGSPLTVGAGPLGLVTKDLDGNGKADLAVANHEGNTVSVLLNDPVEPVTTLTSTPPALTNDPTPTFEFSSSREGTTFECEIDSGGFAPCSSPHTTAPLADGPHAFAVRAAAAAAARRRASRAGDPDPARFEFAVDTEAPETTIVSGPAEGTDVKGKPVFTFASSAPDSTFRCYRMVSRGTIVTPTYFDCASPTELDLSGGAWTFGVFAIDPAGNADPTPEERRFRVLPPPPVNTVRPEIVAVPLQASTYFCNPGTWTGRDESIDYDYTWQRMTKDDRYPGGYAITTVAYGRTYRAASELRPELYSWLFRCVVEASNAGGTTTADSPSKTLDPTYDPLMLNPPFGNIRIRGIDVFQTVQPTAQAQMWHWPGTSDPFEESCGGGTPTSYIKAVNGACVKGPQDLQLTSYTGVTLDRNKPTQALVYGDIEGRYAPDLEQRFELRLTRVVSGQDKETIRQQVRVLPRSDAPYVTPAQRGSTAFAQRVAIPASWLLPEGDRLDLRAEISFVRGFTQVNWRECENGVDCSRDNAFTLYALLAETAPRVKVASVDMADQRQDTWDPNVTLKRAKQLFPGGEGIDAFKTGASVKVSDILSRTIDASECSAWKAKADLNGCIVAGISAALKDWEARNRTVTANGRTIPLADMVMGLKPGSIWTITETGTLENPDSYWYPTFFAETDDRNQPITGSAHEYGHAIGMPHAGKNLSADKTKTDADKSCEGDVGDQVGEFWAPDHSGRLQGTMFDLAPGTSTPRIATDDVAAPLYDLMSYCPLPRTLPQFENDHWISARNWDRVFRTLQAYQRAKKQAAGAARAGGMVARAAHSGPAGAGYAIGTIGPDGAKFERIVPADGSFIAPPANPASAVRLRTLDASGRVIGESGAVVDSLIDHDPGTAATFVGPVPKGAVAVEVARDGITLDRRVRSKAPKVTLLAPTRAGRVGNRRRLGVRWRASDPDGDALRAAVDYSADDGRSWTTLYSGDNSGGLTLSGRTLAASRRARVRVRISDGFDESAGVSGPFRVDGSPPSVRIQSPRRGEAVPEGTRVVLRGSAIDDRKLSLTGGRLAWFEGRRPLGTGEQLVASLAPGRHALRLVATDHLGRKATARTSVRVALAPLTITRLVYKARLARGAHSFTLTIAASAPATLRLRGRSFPVGRRARRVTVTLPARPRKGIVELPVSLSAPGRGRVSGVIALVRGA
jgi:hypothetical protein